MYTVKELMDFLKDVPEDYKVTITTHTYDEDRESFFVDFLGINPDDKTVGLFAE